MIVGGSIAQLGPIQRTHHVTQFLNKEGYLFPFKRMHIKVYTKAEYDRFMGVYGKIKAAQEKPVKG